MNANRPCSEANPSRRGVLMAGLGASAVVLGQRAHAQTEQKLLTRAIPHSGEQLPIVGLGTAVSFPSADDGAAAGAQGRSSMRWSPAAAS